MQVAHDDSFDLDRLLQRADQLQQNAARAKQELFATGAQGVAGGGAVKVTVDGKGQIETLQISPVIADPNNTEGLAEMVVAAVRDAHTSLTAIHRAQLRPLLDSLKAGLGGLS
ncbi:MULTISPECIES: YbaB/EbfC family nucleoid-associated protein [Streptomyces]|uniref:YbaB/EbfC family nucleoid-associated protein n=1 Tax=Streptomyces TaxID=1883 RepID=UPI0023DCFF8D|nr:YbaB/EbfC family nucleoid-associated protein [Streptomyces sp. FXJ1.172]WEP00626.1 YbaB/EbfC family nucleoid-associated protein [Streptomyces sp. FXJ1.172]